jgi:predicted dithiol-disulfide oxidoreductase (DUF899 family)
MKHEGKGVESHPVVTHEAWLAARAALLAKEKEFTRLRDALGRERRALPWERVEKRYAFDAPGGKRALSELFLRKSQLAVYHFMFDPDSEEGCRHCSFWADSFDKVGVHLRQRDVSFLAVSRAPLAKLEAFRRRMGWSFEWVSSFGSDFNRDYGVSFTREELARGPVEYNYKREAMDHTEREGLSVFFKDAQGGVFHTYSTYARGIDLLNTAYNLLDLVPKGRDEDALEFTQAWVRHHDRYAD